ncbi:MAG: ammonia-forming cytochrome c nitrite reductase subunit c552, partial [Proteobacteria bacterium]|nr:ammonia-forming cytochrome c nitrite reductase subunit c552 [Pseudomonadota bacterium]
MKKYFILLLLFFFSLSGYSIGAKKEVANEKIDGKQCYQCHNEIKSLKEGSKHSKLDCGLCHSGIKEHLGNPDTKPVTNLDLEACGKCHKDQYDSFFGVNYHKRAKKEKATPDGRAPLLDKLLSGHGFTREHAEPRSHPYMLIDHITVDRAYGGRFQYKNWSDITKYGKAWDILIDTGKTLPETARAANPTCMTCKTSDMVLKWAYLGEKNPKAKWDRTSDVMQVIKDVQNPAGCIECHDPHSAKHRIIRDALIEVVQKEGDRPYSKNNDKNALNVVEFRGYRKIGLLKKKDSVLQCAQCHVEYACNPGFEKDDFSKKIGLTDPRTNVFPWKNVFDVLKFYDDINFRDYRLS